MLSKRRWRTLPPVLALGALVLVSSIAAAVDDKPAAPGTATPTAPGTVKPTAAVTPTENEIEVLITQALDQRTSLEVKDTPIREALQKLSDKTGIPIEMEIHTVWLLPYGSQTVLTASIQDRPLRESLTALLRPLGLQFVADRDRVAVQPTPALRRIARRATWQELALLESLSSRPWSRELFDSLKVQFQDSSADDLNVNRQTLWKLTSAIGAGSAAEALEHATDQYGWTWYPGGDHIVVLSKTRQVERQLERRVKVRYEQAGIKDVLLDLANWAGVLLRLEPGVLASLPVQTVERFSLAMENGTVRQALEIVAGETGLGYFIEPNGIRITANNAVAASGNQVNATAEATVAALRSNSIVGQITIPASQEGMSFAFFVRESDLPQDVNELRKQKVQQAADAMRRALQTSTRPQD